MNMKSRSFVLTGLALVLSAGFLAVAERAVAQDAQTVDAATCSTEEECACLEALNANTVGALEAYLQQYPSGGGAGSACSTLAFDALLELSTNEDPALADAQDNDPINGTAN